MKVVLKNTAEGTDHRNVFRNPKVTEVEIRSKTTSINTAKRISDPFFALHISSLTFLTEYRECINWDMTFTYHGITRSEVLPVPSSNIIVESNGVMIFKP